MLGLRSLALLGETNTAVDTTLGLLQGGVGGNETVPAGEVGHGVINHEFLHYDMSIGEGDVQMISLAM